VFGLNLHNEFQDQKSLSFSGAKSAYGKIGSGDVARLSFDQRPDGCCSQTTVDRGIFQRPKEMHLPMLTVLEGFHVPMIATGWIGAALALLLSREASGTYCVWSLYVFGLEVLMLALAAGDEDESCTGSTIYRGCSRTSMFCPRSPCDIATKPKEAE